MINLVTINTYDYLGYYKSIKIEDLNSVYNKWLYNIEKIFGKSNKYNKKLIEELSIFFEKYSQMQQYYSNMSFSAFNPTSFNIQANLNLPKDFIKLEDVINKIVNTYEDFLKNDKFSKPTIKEKYYNVITGNEGFLLENGDRIENGILLNDNYHKKCWDDLISEIHFDIDAILDVTKRKQRIRYKKLKRLKSL